MISHLRRLSLPYKIYGPGNTESIFKWESPYYSKSNQSLQYPKEFTIYFPKSPDSIRKCKTMPQYNDVFPDDWSLFVSNDNKTWTNIIENATFCSKNSADDTNKLWIYCKSREVLIHEAKQTNYYYYFVKFIMNSNTYNINPDYKDLITFKGFDIDGTFMTEHVDCTNINTYRYHSFLVTILLMTSSYYYKDN